MSERSVADVLDEAARLIEARGLAKLIRENANGCLCVHGAISMAATGSAEADDDASDAAWGAVQAHLRAKGIPDDQATDEGIAPWNNMPDRTAAEVVAALRETAAALRARTAA